MEGLNKNISSSIKVPKSADSEENDQNCQKIDTTEQKNPRNYVSSRKNILTERNEAVESVSSEPHIQKILNADPKRSSGISSTEHDEFNCSEENSLVANLSSRPYDPLTNYLSPRPKFLRYKPNRGREIFLRQENKFVEGKNELLRSSKRGEEAVSGSGFSSMDDLGNKEAESEEETEEEVEEEDDESEDEGRGWNLKRVLKFLVLGLVMVFSTSYISNMNPHDNNTNSKPSLDLLFRKDVEAILGIKHPSGYDFCDRKVETERSLAEGKMVDLASDEEEREIVLDEKEGKDEDGNWEALEYTKEEGSNGLENVEVAAKGEADCEGEEGLQDEDFLHQAEVNMDETFYEEEDENSIDMGTETLIKEDDVFGTREDDSKEEASSSKVVAGMSILVVTILAYGATKFHMKTRSTLRNETVPILKPCAGSIEKVNKSIMDYSSPVEEADYTDYSTPKPLTLSVYSMEEEEMPFKNSRSPTVELLGEFVIGGGASMKSKENNNSNSVFNKALPEEFSISSSYGSFSVDNKTVKRLEGGRDEGEVMEKRMISTATPVRRSTRIRNRTVMSPP